MLTLKLFRYFIATGKLSEVETPPDQVKCVFNMSKKNHNRILKLAMMAGITVEEWVDRAIRSGVEGTEDIYHKEILDNLSHLFGEDEN